jgi:photosystem II stability/assembly factor-like uncharacterized protein
VINATDHFGHETQRVPWRRTLRTVLLYWIGTVLLLIWSNLDTASDTQAAVLRWLILPLLFGWFAMARYWFAVQIGVAVQYPIARVLALLLCLLSLPCLVLAYGWWSLLVLALIVVAPAWPFCSLARRINQYRVHWLWDVFYLACWALVPWFLANERALLTLRAASPFVIGLVAVPVAFAWAACRALIVGQPRPEQVVADEQSIHTGYLRRRRRRAVAVALAAIAGLAVAGVLTAGYIGVQQAKGPLFASAQWQLVASRATDLPLDREILDLQFGPGETMLYAGFQKHGVYRSSDRGRTWLPLNQGLAAEESVNDLIVGPDAQTLFAATDNGMYRWDATKDRWEPSSTGLPDSASINICSLSPNGSSLVCIIQGTSEEAHVAYRSDDGGQTWQPSDTGLPNAYPYAVLAFAVDVDHSRLFAGTDGYGIYRSDDQGHTWQPANSQATPDLLRRPTIAGAVIADWLTGYNPNALHMASTSDMNPIYARSERWLDYLAARKVFGLAVDPQSKRIIALTDSGVFRSDDGGLSWSLDQQLRAVGELLSFFNFFNEQLVAGPNGQGLFAITQSGSAVPPAIYRSDDGGLSWQVTHLVAADIPSAITAEARGQGLFTGTLNGEVYHSDDKGETWQGSRVFSAPGQPLSPSVLRMFYYYGSSLTIEQTPFGRLRLLRGMFRIQGERMVLFAERDDSSIVRAEIPIPPLLQMPELYLSLVAWIAELASLLNILIGVPLTGGFGFALYLASVYLGRRVKNRVERSLEYRIRWSRCADSIERLILLLAPIERDFAVDDVEQAFRQAGVVLEPAEIVVALGALVEQQLVRAEGDRWRLEEPDRARTQRQRASGEVHSLTAQTYTRHPLYLEVRRFLAQAGFMVRASDGLRMLCTSDMPLWAGISPLYVRLVLDRELDLEEFQALSAAAREAYGGDVRGRTAAVVIDRPPRASDLYQIFALRGQQGLTVVPLPHSLMVQAQLDSREIEALKEQFDVYTGRTDLYDIRSAVTDVLSFFGRANLLADLQRRLTGGQSMAVFGVRKMGKSSLMGRLREECDWPVAVVDLEGYIGGLGYVYEEALRAWRAAIRASVPDITIPEESHIDTSTTAAAQAQVFRVAVGQLLDLLATQPGRPGLLLCLDEIDVLFGQAEYHEFAGALRSLAETPRWRGRFAILAAGLNPLLSRLDRVDGQRNSFFAFFGELPLPPLERDDARTMVVSIGAQMGVSYTDDALDMLVEAGGGHPFLTRQLCSQAVRGLDRPAQVDGARAAEAIDAYLRQPRNYLAESLWGMESGGPTPQEVAVFTALVTAGPQPEEVLIPSELAPQEQRARQLALDQLVDQSLIRARDGVWELTIPLYGRWIRRYVLSLPKHDTVDQKLSDSQP